MVMSGRVVPDIRGAIVSAAEMRLYKDTGMAAVIWLVAGLLAGSGLIVGRNPRMSSRCVSSSDAGRAGRKARRVVLRTFLGAAFVTAAGGTLTLAQGWREASWLFLIAPALVALIAAVRISASESQRSSATAVVPALWALLFGLPVLVAGYAVFSLRDPSLSLSSDRLRIGGAYGERILWNELFSVRLADTLPFVEERTDGLGTGTIRKGYFRLRGIGTAKLMLTSDKGPYIYMRKRSGQYVVLNFGEAERTVRSYERISEMLDKTTSNDSVCLCE